MFHQIFLSLSQLIFGYLTLTTQDISSRVQEVLVVRIRDTEGNFSLQSIGVACANGRGNRLHYP